jgi:hypothetical protein
VGFPLGLTVTEITVGFPFGLTVTEITVGFPLGLTVTEITVDFPLGLTVTEITVGFPFGLTVTDNSGLQMYGHMIITDNSNNHHVNNQWEYGYLEQYDGGVGRIGGSRGRTSPEDPGEKVKGDT